MGAQKIETISQPRVVLDTNIFISAILFSGEINRLVPLWQNKRILLLVSSEVLMEYIAVLSYPKFRLAREEVNHIIKEEFLSFAVTVTVKTKVDLVREDPSDNKFLTLAIDGKADYIISGDRHLLELRKIRTISIVPPKEFLLTFGG